MTKNNWNRTFFALLFTVMRCNGQEERADAFLREQIARQHIPGLSQSRWIFSIAAAKKQFRSLTYS